MSRITRGEAVAPRAAARSLEVITGLVAAVDVTRTSALDNERQNSSIDTARPPTLATVSAARSGVRFATRTSEAPSTRRHRRVVSPMSPAPRTTAVLPSREPKTLMASRTAADGIDAAPRPSSVSERTAPPTARPDWKRRCSTGPTPSGSCRPASYASPICPRISASPRTSESRLAATRKRCTTVS